MEIQTSSRPIISASIVDAQEGLLQTHFSHPHRSVGKRRLEHSDKKMKHWFLYHFLEQEENKVTVIRDSFPTLVLKTNEKWIRDCCADYFKDCCHLHVETSNVSALFYKQSLLPISFLFNKVKDQCQTLVKRLKQFFEHTIVKLLPHQKELVEVVKSQITKQESILVYWEMGYGKSIGSLATFSELHVKDIYILCVNSAILQWAHEICKLPQPAKSATTFHILGLTEFARILLEDNEDLLQGQVVIFDEAHMFRNITDIMRQQIQSLRQSRFCLNLSGTPLINNRSDAIGLCLIHRSPWDIIDKQDLTPQETLQLLRDTFHPKRVHYYNPKSKSTNHYPPHTIIYKKVEMTWQQTLDYMVCKRANFTIGDLTICTSRRNSYHTKTKQLSSVSVSGDCPKLDACAAQVLTSNVFPQLIVLEYLHNGYYLLEKLKPHVNVAFAEGVSGTEQREELRLKYNNKKLDVLILSRIGNTSWNLIGTRIIHLPNSYENLQLRSQAIGRGLRYKSHEPDPETKEIAPVLVYEYISIFPKPHSIPKDLHHYFQEQYLGKPGFDLSNFNTLLLEKMQKEEDFQTIDEKLCVSNQAKQQLHIEPCLQLLQNLSI